LKPDYIRSWQTGKNETKRHCKSVNFTHKSFQTKLFRSHSKPYELSRSGIVSLGALLDGLPERKVLQIVHKVMDSCTSEA